MSEETILQKTYKFYLANERIHNYDDYDSIPLEALLENIKLITVAIRIIDKYSDLLWEKDYAKHYRLSWLFHLKMRNDLYREVYGEKAGKKLRIASKELNKMVFKELEIISKRIPDITMIGCIKLKKESKKKEKEQK